MEATGKDMGMLLNKIIPPKLEDAGLEDCALPPDSIHQVFLKAASAVALRAAACVTDTTPDPPSEELVGVRPEAGPPAGPCAAPKGVGVWGGGRSDLVGGEMNEGDVEKKDEVVVVVGGGGVEGGTCGGCVEGLKIKERENVVSVDDDDEKDKKPTLVDGYFFNS